MGPEAARAQTGAVWVQWGSEMQSGHCGPTPCQTCAIGGRAEGRTSAQGHGGYGKSANKARVGWSGVASTRLAADGPSTNFLQTLGSAPQEQAGRGGQAQRYRERSGAETGRQVGRASARGTAGAASIRQAGPGRGVGGPSRSLPWDVAVRRAGNRREYKRRLWAPNIPAPLWTCSLD